MDSLEAFQKGEENGQGAAEKIINDLLQKTFSDSEFEQAN